MKSGWKMTPFVLLGIVYLLVPAIPAYGYVDPNATGLITQIMTPLLVVAATGLTFLRKQVSFTFRRIFGRTSNRND